MEDSSEILWNLYEQHCLWERHHEEQRASGSGLLIGVAAGVLGLITFDGHLNISDIPLTLFLVMQGVLGTLFTAKHYERFRMHQQRAGQYRDLLDSRFPDLKINILRHAADENNNRKFPHLHKLRLHHFWGALHLFIALFGLVLTAGILLKWFV